jgi:hypothetical protein
MNLKQTGYLMIFLLLLGLLIPVYTHTEEQISANQEAEMQQLLEQLSLDETLYSLNFMRCGARFRPMLKNFSPELDAVIKQLNPNPSIYDGAICETLYMMLIHAMAYNKVQVASEDNTKLSALFNSCQKPKVTLQEFEQEAAEYFKLLYPHAQTFVNQLSLEELVIIALINMSPNSIADKVNTFSRTVSSSPQDLNLYYQLMYTKACDLIHNCTPQQQTLFDFQCTPENFDMLVQASSEQKQGNIDA